MGKPSLWRYYGLSALLALAITCWSLLGILGRGLEQKWLFEWSGRIGLPIVGLCFLLRGLDFIMLCKTYPPFLREKAPKWAYHAHKVSPAALLYMGIWFTLGGAAMAYFGGRNLVLTLLGNPP